MAGLRFDTLGLGRIVSMVSEKNLASRRVAEKLGMTVEREAMWGDLPHLMYSLYSLHRDRGDHESAPMRAVERREHGTP